MDVQSTHAALISAMDTFYRTLLDLDYLRGNEVQFPPHAGKDGTPLAIASIQAANLTPEVQSLLHHLPCITDAAVELTEGESAITLHSQPVSYLYKGVDRFESGERWFGYGEGGEEVLLPPWGVLLFSGIRRDQRVVIYDTRSRRIAELSVYSPTVRQLEAASTSIDELLGSWIRHLQTFDWIPWRDEDRFLGMEIPPSSEQESCLKEPDKRRLELLERLPLDVAEEKFAGEMRSAREDHNCYWAKRGVYEAAGWPRVLDKGRLREGIRSLEQALWDAWDCAEGVEEE